MHENASAGRTEKTCGVHFGPESSRSEQDAPRNTSSLRSRSGPDEHDAPNCESPAPAEPRPLKRGFTRIPNAWLDTPLSPGALSLLVFLCSLANERGESWSSLGQLGERMGRSKAALSGYLSELKDAGIAACETQRTANGFNYRLKVRLTDWAALLRAPVVVAGAQPAASNTRQKAPAPVDCHDERVASHHPTDCRPQPLSPTSEEPDRRPGGASSAPKIERRVQRTERKDPTGQINIHKTKTPAHVRNDTNDIGAGIVEAGALWSEVDEQDWKRAEPNTSGYNPPFHRTPSDALLKKVIAWSEATKIAAGQLNEHDAASEAGTIISDLAHELTGQRLPAETQRSCAAAIVKRLRTRHGMLCFADALRTIWKPHWRRFSSPGQLEAHLDEALAKDPCAYEDRRAAARAMRMGFLATLEMKNRTRRAAILSTLSKQKQKTPHVQDRFIPNMLAFDESTLDNGSRTKTASLLVTSAMGLTPIAAARGADHPRGAQ